MNKLQELMVITMEEAGELTQVCSKIIRMFEDFDKVSVEYKDKLTEEVGDVYCMIELMLDYGIIEEEAIYKRSGVKREKLKQWSNLIDAVPEA